MARNMTNSGAVMRRILAALALSLLIASPVLAARPVPVVASITLNEAGPFGTGSAVTFTTTVPKLKGSEYPLIYLACTVSGRVVYGQLDLPNTVFILGGGSSPWITPSNPDYRSSATCVAYLYAYGTWQSNTADLLAHTPPFAAG